MEINIQKERKVYTFTLHLEEDKELVKYLEHNKITKSVKKGLRMLFEEERKQKQIELLEKEQLLNIISLLVHKTNTSLNNPVSQERQRVSIDKEEVREEIDNETKTEFENLLQQTGGLLGPINLNIPGRRE